MPTTLVSQEFGNPLTPSSPRSAGGERLPGSGSTVNRGRRESGDEELPAVPDSLQDALSREPPPFRRESSQRGQPLEASSGSYTAMDHGYSSQLLPQMSGYSPLLDPGTINSRLAHVPQTAPILTTSNSTLSTKNIFKSKSKGALSNSASPDLSLRTSPSQDTLSQHPGTFTPSLTGSSSALFSSSSTSTSQGKASTAKKSLWSKFRSKPDTTAPEEVVPSLTLPARPTLIRTSSQVSAVSGISDGGAALSRTQSAYGTLDEDSEVERLEQRMEQSAARRASHTGSGGGRGIDQELDDMDFESDRVPRRNGGAFTRGDEVAIPWRARTEKYTFDLAKGEEYDSEGEDVEVVRDSATPRRLAGGDAAQPRLFLRRHPEIPALHIPSSADDIDPGPRTAPLAPSVHLPFSDFPIPPGMLEPHQDTARSISAGNVALGDKDILGEKELAAGLGLPAAGIFSAEPHVLINPVRPSGADFVVAMVGPRGVGKSTIIRKGLKRPMAKPIVILQDDKENRATSSISQFNLSGNTRTVEVLEIDMAILKYDVEGVLWPAELPQMDGIMCCYDATDPLAIGSLSVLLHAFWSRSSDTPMIVLACKASSEDKRTTLDMKKVAQICNVYGAGIVSLDGGIEDADKKMKNSFNWMIRTIMDARGELRRPSVVSNTSSVAGTEPVWSRGSSRQGSVSSPSALNPPASAANSRRTSLDVVTMLATASESHATPTLHPSESSEVEVVQDALYSGPVISIEPPEAVLPVEAVDEQTKSLDLHFSKEDLIDKLLFASVTGNDEQYVTLFLIVYRRFTRPFDVLSKLIERFEFVGGRLQTDPLLSRFAQMKLCGLLSIWFQAYPTDFAAPATFNLVRCFLEDLLPRGATWVVHYSVELLPLLREVTDDPDSCWGIPDESVAPPPSQSMSPPMARRPSVAPSLAASLESSRSFELPQRDSFSETRTRLSIATAASTTDSHPSDHGALTLSDALSPSIKSASGRPRKGQVANLLQVSNMLLDLSEDAVATQITRLAWDAFSQITPRDLLRHVLAPRNSKDPRSLGRDTESSVLKSINFVNYLADWVASVLLVQSKVKHRVRLMEKFIGIACRLREQENFDSLMAILAGLSSQPVFRLSETTDALNLKLEGDKAIPPKRLRSLNKLMSSNRSFGAYRIALANSGAYMLPYLGVHLQEITLINEVKKSSVDGAVNWTKFQQMSRASAIVLDCSRLSPQLVVDRSIENCIMTSVLDMDAQYALSYTHQARSQPAGGRNALRKIVDRAADTFTSV